MNEIFDYCVKLLYWAASLTGTTYEEINVILFVFLIPLLILVLLVKLMLLKQRIKELEKLNKPKSHTT
jgi:hypothetical protein